MSLVVRLYAALLRLYPRAFRAEFGEEMQAVFVEAVTDAAARGSSAAFLLRELRDAPLSLAGAYWADWTKNWQEVIKFLSEVAPTADLPAPPPDGRDSWRQVGAELSLFLLAGLGLTLVTYLPMARPPLGWERDLGLLGKVIVPVTLPVFLIGLARGLPRWAYPYGGLLLSYSTLNADQSVVLPFLGATLFASVLLAGLAAKIYAPLSPLPTFLRRIGQSLSLDWTRLSFGLYGALPLAIISAFDDAHFNNRTPYLALAAVMMVVCALAYSRSRHSAWQSAALLGGLSFSIGAAALDEASFANGLGNWIAAPRPTPTEVVWMLNLWLSWAALLLAPALLFVAARVGKPSHAV